MQQNDKTTEHTMTKPQTTEIEGWTIYTNIPPPRRGPGAYPFKHLKIGHSFVVENKKKFSSALVMASQFKKRNTGFNYTTEHTPKGLRIWRISSNGK